MLFDKPDSALIFHPRDQSAVLFLRNGLQRGVLPAFAVLPFCLLYGEVHQLQSTCQIAEKETTPLLGKQEPCLHSHVVSLSLR